MTKTRRPKGKKIVTFDFEKKIFTLASYLSILQTPFFIYNSSLQHGKQQNLQLFLYMSIHLTYTIAPLYFQVSQRYCHQTNCSVWYYVNYKNNGLTIHFSMSSAVPMCARRWYSTEQPLPTPGANATVDPKISAIVDQIEGLTLLQTSELVSQLKVLKKKRLPFEIGYWLELI